MNRIKDLREDADMTLEQLGAKIQATKSTVSKYEREKLSLSPEIIDKLCALFDVSADYLLGRTNKKEPPVEDERPSADVRAAQLRLADDLYDCLTPENRAKADSYLAYLLAEQAGPGDKQ